MFTALLYRLPMAGNETLTSRTRVVDFQNIDNQLDASQGPDHLLCQLLEVIGSYSTAQHENSFVEFALDGPQCRVPAFLKTLFGSSCRLHRLLRRSVWCNRRVCGMAAVTSAGTVAGCILLDLLALCRHFVNRLLERILDGFFQQRDVARVHKPWQQCPLPLLAIRDTGRRTG